MPFHKILTFLLIAAGATLAGCGDTTSGHGSSAGSNVVSGTGQSKPAPEAAKHEQVRITKSGFTQLSPDSIGSSYITYGAVLFNPNSSSTAEVQINFTFSDGSNAVVKSTDDRITILPSQYAAIGDSSSGSGATTVEVKALVSRWEEVTHEQGDYTMTQVRMGKNDFSGVKTTARAHSTFAKDQKFVRAVAVYEDAAGNVVGGAHSFVEFVPAGGDIGIEITDTGTSVRTPAKAEVFLES